MSEVFEAVPSSSASKEGVGDRKEALELPGACRWDGDGDGDGDRSARGACW